MESSHVRIESLFICIDNKDKQISDNQILIVKLDKNGEKTWEKLMNFSDESDGAYSVLLS